MNEILKMLSHKRPAGSKTENIFIQRYLDTLPGMKRDRAGNRILRVGPEPDILWSCHTDTVHTEAGFTQPVESNGIVSANGEILGADDCAGVWLMREMILAKKPGLYIFHRGEEIGGVGSQHIATNNPGLLEGIKAAIALDRMGQTDIITHMGERTCSDTFALSLGHALRIKELKPCSGGVFTDTLNYAGIVPECTNISVGYVRAHSKHETLDIQWLDKLLDALLELDTAELDTPGFEPERQYSFTREDKTGFLAEYIRQYPERIAQMLIDYGLEDEIYTH